MKRIVADMDSVTFDDAKQLWRKQDSTIMIGRVKFTLNLVARSINGWALLINPDGASMYQDDEVTPLCLLTQTELLEKLQCNG